MKVLLAILVAAGVGFAAAYVYVSNQQANRARREQAELEGKWQSEREQLEKDLKSARNRAPKIEQIQTTVEVPVVLKATPKEILDRLVKLKPAAGNARYQSIRQIVHQLENLADLGPESLSHIRAFLQLSQDISYEREREEENSNRGDAPPGPGTGSDARGGDRGRPGGGPREGGNNGLPRTENYYPFSLRLGLFNVLKEIGGNEAEVILAEALGTTGRGVEVATLTDLLEQLAPNKYRDLALSAAKELLSSPLKVANPSRLDEASQSYLYAVLAKYQDASFAPTAQTLLVSAAGHIDRGALNYLTTMLKEQSLPALYQAYKDSRVTNLFEKARVLSSVMNYAGPNPTANDLFKEVIGNESAGPGRFFIIGQLDNGILTPQVIQARIPLLQSIKPTLQDERIQAYVDRTIQNLQNKLNPENAVAGGEGRRGERRGPPRPGR